MEPSRPPIDMHVQLNVLRSSAPVPGYLRACMTISESMITSEKAMLKLETNSIQMARVSLSAYCRPKVIIVMNYRRAPVTR